jgi:hypothetical protein
MVLLTASSLDSWPPELWDNRLLLFSCPVAAPGS